MSNFKPLKIAQIAPIIERVPPKKYGGTERVVNVLTEGLIKRGHEVTLFATGDSLTSAKLVSVAPKALKESAMKDPYGPNAITALHVGVAYKMFERFDIIHDHIGSISLPTANLSKTPVVMTLHGPFTPEFQDMFSTLTKPYLVTISQAQLKQAPKVNHAGTVYNGLNMEYYPFKLRSKGYLLFVGRITREKGVHFAIEVAKKLNLPLIIAAKLETAFKPDIDYFKRYIKPQLNDQIVWVGEVTEDERNKLMSNALCFLHPITWAEPFGLVLIESMACGCPVVGFGLGSIPEIIVNGKSGFVVSNVDEMVSAVKKIKTIDRLGCRNYAIENFSGERMVKGYEQIYNQILEYEQQKPKPYKVNIPLMSSPAGTIYRQVPERIYDLSYANDIRAIPSKPKKKLPQKN